MSDWISVKDRLPEGANGNVISETVIAYTVEDDAVVGWNHNNIWYLILPENDYVTEHENDYVTHWMPLPEPPKEG